MTSSEYAIEDDFGITDEYEEQGPVIITASINDGAFKPIPRAVPQTVDEVVESVVRCYEEGAAIAHLHGLYETDVDGEWEIEPETWAEMHDRIKEECDIITQLGLASFTESRFEIIEAADSPPDMMSVNLSHWDGAIEGEEDFHFIPLPKKIEMLEYCNEHGIKPELEIHYPGSVWYLHYLQEEGYIEPPYWVNLPYGIAGGNWAPGKPSQLDARRELLPESAYWHVPYYLGQKGTGDPVRQRRFHTYAMLVGGNVRAGVEENGEFRDESPEEAAASIVSEVADIADLLYRGTASPDEARAILGME